jgi:hypothetical protein
LQQNTDLTMANWVAVTNTQVVVGTNYQVTVVPTGGNRFYRLKYP